MEKKTNLVKATDLEVGKNLPVLTNEYLYALIKKQGEQIAEHGEELTHLKKEMSTHGRNIREIQEEYPLDPCMADEISKAVKIRGVAVLGGKKSGAYNTKSLRTKLYQDIYTELKRQYGLFDENGYQVSYKHLKKKDFKHALRLIESYEPPLSIANEIMAINEVDELFDENED